MRGRWTAADPPSVLVTHHRPRSAWHWGDAAFFCVEPGHPHYSIFNRNV